jgi:hypothetical protein
LNADSTSPEKLKDLIEAAGLTDVTTRPIEISVTFRNFDDYWNSNTGFASPVATLVKRLTGDKRRQLIQLLKTKSPIDEQGVILYSAGVNTVKGRT